MTEKYYTNTKLNLLHQYNTLPVVSSYYYIVIYL